MNSKVDLFSEEPVVKKPSKSSDIKGALLVKDATELAKENYTDYSKYCAQGRAYPNIVDGLKTAYKRAIYGMYLNNKKKVVKVAELAAHALPFHPHPTSISGVIIQLGDRGNNLKLIETQGNWGDSTKRVMPSADRYIGGYLTSFAESLLCDSVEYCNFIKGEIEKDEPEALPALLPLCFVNGAKGIPSGLPTLNIPTVDILGMIDYYIDILQHKKLDHQPKKFPKPNYNCAVISSDAEWNTVMKTGKGSIKLAPIMSIDKAGVITITELPLSKNFENVKKIIEKEILQDKVDARDESTADTCIVIEKVPHKQCDMNELYKRLYNKLQASEACNMAFFDQDKIYVPCGFDKVVKANLKYLMETHANRMQCQMNDLKNKLAVLLLIEQLKKGNDIKKLVDMSYVEACEYIAQKYKTTIDIATKAMQKPLSYLTKEHMSEILELEDKIKELENDHNDVFEFLLKKYKQLKKEIVKYIK